MSQVKSDNIVNPQDINKTPKVCEACKFAPGKSVSLTEQEVCAVCLKPVEWLAKRKESVRNNSRPTKYREEMVAQVDEYIAWATEKNKDFGMGYKELIGIEGFAVWLGVTTVSLWGWANKKQKVDEIDPNTGKPTGKRIETNKLERPNFFNAIKRLKEHQKNQLIRDGFYGGRNVNANMGIFLLKVNHDMVEVEHVDHTTAGEKLDFKMVTYK